MIENAKSYLLCSEDTKEVIISIYREDHCLEMEKSHCHPLMEIFLMVDGKGKMRTDDGRITHLSKGDVMVFKSMESHQLYDIDEEYPVEMLTVAFVSNVVLSKEYGWFDSKLLDIFYDRLDNFENKISSDSKTAEKIRRIMLEMESEFESTFNNEYVLKAQLLQILAILVQHYNEYFERKKIKNIKHLKEIENTMVYINQHLTEDITLEKLSKIANMNKSYYSTVFKKINEMTVWDYILNARIELAISYLLNKKNHMTILEIASFCGFNNTANFNKRFKQITGKTPNEYRKKWL